jgi:chloride channel protein, CIC family
VRGVLGTRLVPAYASDVGLYSMLGMGAMMGATLQAPLASLLALLELTGNPNIILPGMLAILSATLATKELFGCESVFVTQMRALWIDQASHPFAQTLRGIGVSAVMSRALRTTAAQLSSAEAAALLEGTPQWIMVESDDGKESLPAADLARHLASNAEKTLDLLEIPVRRRTLAAVPTEATLQFVLQALERAKVEAVCVEASSGLSRGRTVGVLTREQIESAYRYACPGG